MLSAEQLCYIASFLPGLGLGFVGLAPIICVQLYFNKYRPFALGFSMVGYGIGTLIGMPLLQFAIDAVGWRCAVILQAGQYKVLSYTYTYVYMYMYYSSYD